MVTLSAPTATVDVQLNIPNLPYDVPTPASPQAPKFHDIWVPRIGAQWSLYETQQFQMKLRGGYFFETRPLRHKTKQQTTWMATNMAYPGA